MNIIMDSIEDRINTNYELTEEEHSICDGSYSEILLHYITNPLVLLTHVYESITTMSWKFIF